MADFPLSHRTRANITTYCGQWGGYLGSMVSSNASLDAEINSRIRKAAAIMSKLQKESLSK